MKDHATAMSRLACGQPVVAIQQPSWVFELVCALCLVLVIAWSVAIARLVIERAEHGQTINERDMWKGLALTPPPPERPVPTVRFEPHANGFKCLHFNVRREWEKAVAAQCQEMASLLYAARATK